jgi:predicted ATP-dependent protease
MVLQGLIARRFARNAPLSFDCSVTFEQLYGGVEGDSASMAEYVAIISDLSDVPIRQDVAITGSVNQLGEAQVIGGVHHKVEGFFRTCRDNGGLSGSQGVIVPAANTQNLVLRDEVADAVAAGNFHIWTVKTVDEAVALFTGMESGLDEHGALPADIDGDTVYGRVIATLNDFDEALAKRHL